MTQESHFRVSEGKLVLIAIIGAMAAFGIALAIISGGAVRQSKIFLPEKTQDTIAFRNVEGQVKVVGTNGVAGINPTLTMRTGDFAMELTVINDDSNPHVLYIDGLNLSTKVLRPGDSQVLMFYSKGEATYNYYDWNHNNNNPLGQIRAVKVTMYE
jgi:hypothetical protein